jgi:hypothetical protein
MIMPVKPTHILLFLSLSASTCFGQDGAAPTPLRVLEEIPVTSLQLNGNGFRVTMGKSEFYIETGAGRYVAVDLEGRSRTALDLAKIPATDFGKSSELFVVDLSPEPRGGVNALVLSTRTKEATNTSLAKEEQRFGIVCFDDHGEFDELIPLDTGPDFNPTHVGEFSSGKEFLIAGYGEHGRVFLSIFGNRGELLIPHLHPTKYPALDADKQRNTDDTKPTARGAVAAGIIQLAAGDDDAVYLFDPSRGRQALRIRPDGISEDITLPEPSYSKDLSTQPLGFYVSHSNLYISEAILDKGQAAGDAMELKRFGLSVYDRYTGALTASFEIDKTYGATPVALSPREFHFLNAKVAARQGLSFSIIRTAP